MSYTETHIGKLKKVEITTSLNKWCEAKCKEKGILELDRFDKDWIERFKDDNEVKFFFVGENVWETIEHIEIKEGNDIDIANVNEDGTISFVMQFYNGGTCLSECIEEKLEKLTK